MKKKGKVKKKDFSRDDFRNEHDDNFKIKRRKKIKDRNRAKKIKAYLGQDIDDLGFDEFGY